MHGLGRHLTHPNQSMLHSSSRAVLVKQCHRKEEQLSSPSANQNTCQLRPPPPAMWTGKAMPVPLLQCDEQTFDNR